MHGRCGPCSLLKLTGDVCDAYAQAVSCFLSFDVNSFETMWSDPITDDTVLLVYLFSIILIRLLVHLCQEIPIDATPQSMLLLTYREWFREVTDKVLAHARLLRIQTPTMVQNIHALYSSCILYVPSCLHILSSTSTDPKCFRSAETLNLNARQVAGLLEQSYLIGSYVLPRNVEYTIIKEDGSIIGLPACLADLRRMVWKRTERIMTSIDELEMVVLATWPGNVQHITEGGIPRENIEQVLQVSLRRAQAIKVRQDDKTEAFVSCQMHGTNSLANWRQYKVKCQIRHKWGELLRSSLEWDWNPSDSLMKLFEPEAIQVHVNSAV